MGYSDETEAEEEPATDSAGLKTKSPVSEFTNLVRPAQLWKRALKKLQSVDLDPWLDFQTHTVPARTAVRHRYSVIKKKWIADKIWVKIESVPFDRGAMRECFRLKKLPQSGSHANDWQYASNYVAKRYITNVDRQVYFDDVRLQMEAKLWGEAFNRQNPPKKVDIFQLSVLELRGTLPHDAKVRAGEAGDSSAGSNELSSFYHIERYMEGEYRKYNSNSGFVDEQLRNTPQAFSHFTFERSGHRLLVVDIQGVGDLYTDPQIHTSDGVGYSDGNLGPRGMALFFHSHRCNPLCEWLGLTPFDLAEGELGADAQPGVLRRTSENANGSVGNCPFNGGPEQKPSYKTGHTEEDAKNSKTNQTEFVEPNVIAMVRARVPPRRRAVSFSQSNAPGSGYGNRFGPTVARSTENMQHAGARPTRRRSESQSISSDDHPPSSAGFILFNGSSLSNLLDPEDDIVSVGPFATLKLDTMVPIIPNAPLPGPSNLSLTPPLVNSSSNDSQFPRPMLAFDPFPVNLPRRTRDRAASGDSGYSGPGLTNSTLLSSVTPHIFPHIDPSTTALIRSGLEASSVSSLIDYSVPASPVGPPVLYQSQFSMPPSSHSLYTGGVDEMINGWSGVGSWNHGWNHVPSSRIPSVLPRRRRNLSESSDLDFDDEHRMTGNLLHQLMHENHKPSSADHPTNLDQEIGQSILGQIHHELARLHEAGRFIPNCKGGWSHAGIGGLLLRNDGLDEPDEICDDCAHPDNNNCLNALSHNDSLTTRPEHSIDWAAVLFHERHAAQLGCLEAMIVMAHYYLGLPTQLMLDCPIKPNQSDLRSGVDYLGRAAEGGDRRCMILLARFLDVSASLSDSTHAVSKTTRPDDFLLLPALLSANRDAVPLISSDPWAEAITWYKKAVDTAGASASGDGAPDEGLDAEGRYDAAEDLLPVYRILARMAEMYSIGGFGLNQDSNMAGDLFTQAGELASAARQGRLAATYFELGEEAYGNCE